MRLSKNKIYFRKDLQAYLKFKKLPSSRDRIVHYEKLGIIDRPKKDVSGMEGGWRIYSREEIIKIAKQIKSYLKKNYPYVLEQKKNARES